MGPQNPEARSLKTVACFHCQSNCIRLSQRPHHPYQLSTLNAAKMHDNCKLASYSQYLISRLLTN